jgi:hypothetical protein
MLGSRSRNKKPGGSFWAPGGCFRCGEIVMPFDQNSQAEIGGELKIVGTKVESLGAVNGLTTSKYKDIRPA